MKQTVGKHHQHAHFYDAYKASMRERYGWQTVLFTLMLLGALGGSLLFVYRLTRERDNLTPVLADTPTPTHTADGNTRCVSLGGQLVMAGRCQLADGRICELSEYLAEGVCRDVNDGVVLGIAEEDPVEEVAYITPTPAMRTQYYLLELQPQNLDALDSRMLLADFLFASLEFERQAIPIQAMRQILYDTRTTDPYADARGYARYEGTYYLVIEWLETLDNRIYSYPHINIQVTPIDTPTFPEIDDRRYCDSDAACEVRTNICTYGAYNHFQSYLDRWSCPAIVTQDGGLRSYYDEDLQCQVQVTYVQPSCVDNRCVAGSRVVQCL